MDTHVLLPSVFSRLPTLCTESPSPHTLWISPSTSSTNPTMAQWTDGSSEGQRGLMRSQTDWPWTATPLDHGPLEGQAQTVSREPGPGAHSLHRKVASVLPSRPAMATTGSHPSTPRKRPGTLALSAFCTTASSPSLGTAGGLGHLSLPGGLILQPSQRRRLLGALECAKPTHALAFLVLIIFI